MVDPQHRQIQPTEKLCSSHKGVQEAANLNSQTGKQVVVVHDNTGLLNVEIGASLPLMQSPLSNQSNNSSIISPANVVDHFEPFTDREANLMRNFTENMALWLDVTDIERHFEIEVPRRALRDFMLRYAIFAFSARHIAERQRSSDLTEALEYHNKALQLLIPQLSGPEEGLTVDVFVAVLILRLDEEWHEQDNRFHLVGATRILNSISSFICSGGLGEAAAWLCLRQDLAISIISQQPLKTSLMHFKTCQSIQRDDDISWALKMILLLSSILTYIHLPQSPFRAQKLHDLEGEIQIWQEQKPISYEPIKSISRGKKRGCRVPVLWMLSSFHVLGALSYHIAKILIHSARLRTADERVTGVETFQNIRKTERSMKEHLLTILGLAMSNPRSQNTLYSAKHALETYGGLLRHQLDREAAIEFLRFAQDVLGWKMEKILESLQRTWEEDPDSE